MQFKNTCLFKQDRLLFWDLVSNIQYLLYEESDQLFIKEGPKRIMQRTIIRTYRNREEFSSTAATDCIWNSAPRRRQPSDILSW